MNSKIHNMGAAYAGIFLLAGSVILFEIALTRVFAIMMWHHFTYMVISIALLGFGTAGSFLTIRGNSLRTESPIRAITLCSLCYGATVMLAFCFATLVEIDSLAIHEDPSNIAALLLIYLIIVVPFLFAGAAIGMALTRWSDHVNRLYFADLLGSAAGGGLSVLCLSRLGNAPCVMLAGALGVLSAFVFSLGAPRSYRLLTGPVVIAAACIAWWFGSGSLTWEIPFAPGKELNAHAETTDPRVQNISIDRAIPSATAEVEVTTSFTGTPMIGGNFGIVDRRGDVEVRGVAQDGTAPTMMYRNASDIGSFPFLDDTQAASAFVALNSRGATSPDVLAIGVGGGVDVMMALAHDAHKVTAVEINSAMIKMVTDIYDDYLGHLFTGDHEYSDRINLVNMEGRSYMRSREESYDIIQMSGVDSFTALSTGAYTLSESYLYTVEAVQEFYRHLNDQGYINYSRFILNHPKKPRETLRLVNIARAALAAEGIEDPAAHILVFQGREWASTIIKRGPFTRVEVDALVRFARRQEVFKGLVFDPLHSKGTPFGPPADLVAEVEKEAVKLLPSSIDDPSAREKAVAIIGNAFASAFRNDEDAVTRDIDEFTGLLPEAARVDTKTTLNTIIHAGAKAIRSRAAPFLKTRGDFETLLRGESEERKDFVSTYEYDITPCTDDAPFFFNYYKYSALFGNTDTQGESSSIQNRYHPDFPVGHMVLLASLVQIAILALTFILLPLRTLRRSGVPTPGKYRYLAYFTALGVGFMFVEIVLMQKLVIFLGHPTYALSVVLTSLLGFAGVGSLLAGRITRVTRKVLMRLMFLVVGLILLEGVALNHLLPHLLGWSMPARIAVVVALLAPLGTVMGIPFPSGLRILKEQCPQLLPWGWAINGFCSVLASVLCIVLSMALGFTKVLVLAAAVYAIGFLLMRAEEPGSAPSE